MLIYQKMGSRRYTQKIFVKGVQCLKIAENPCTKETTNFKMLPKWDLGFKNL